jgi:hypothetical protein
MTMSLPPDGRGFRPGAVTAASSLAAVAGTLTFALSVVLFSAMFGHVASSDLRTIITWLAVITQLAGSLLLLLGGGQLANGVGRKRIVIGASMLLLVFPAHLYYVEMELRRDPAEGDAWKYVLPFTRRLRSHDRHHPLPGAGLWLVRRAGVRG